MTNQSIAAIRRALLAWYDRHRRPLPWRRTNPNAYHIWVAEIMLQQTQVVSVLPYWKRFIKRLPNTRRLADAAIDEVLELWSGLGYYRRAHFLHSAARVVVSDHGGRIPRDVAALMSLPGIGRYTAGAISSIAFGRRAALVDGNVRRVLTRLFQPVAASDASGGAVERLWDLAGQLVPEDRPGDFNQALMELGALVCLPSSPRCGDCPFKRRCAARALGIRKSVWSPGRQRRKALLEVASLLLARRGRVLLVKRPKTGLWAGLWDVPSLEVDDGAVPVHLAARLLDELGMNADRVQPLDIVTRQLTHRIYRAHVFVVSGLRGSAPRSKRYTWYDPRTASCAISRAAQHIIRLV